MVTIILPCYNVEKYIRRGLDSIISQTFQNWTAILVNDGSTDNTGNICEEYAHLDSRFQVIHKKNGGVSSARNIGLENATGEYVYFMDPDDWIEPNLLDCSVSELEKSKCEMVQFDRYWVSGAKKMTGPTVSYKHYEHDSILRTYTGPMLGLGQNALDGWYRGNFIWNYKIAWQVFCFMFRRDLLQRVKLRFIEELKMSEDILFALEASIYANKITSIPDILYNYDQREDGTVQSRSHDPEKVFRDKYLLIEHRERIRKIVTEFDLFDYYFASQVLSSIELAIKLSNRIRNYTYLNTYVTNASVRQSIKKVSLCGAPLKFRIPVLLLKWNLHPCLFFFCWMTHKLGFANIIKM